MKNEQKALHREKFTLDNAISFAEKLAEDSTETPAAIYRQMAEWFKELRFRKALNEAGRDFTTQFALAQHYDRAMGCLEDAKFVCTEKEYYGINALVHQTISELEAIGELAEIKKKEESKNTRVAPKVNTPKVAAEVSAEEKKPQQLGNNTEMRNCGSYNSTTKKTERRECNSSQV